MPQRLSKDLACLAFACFAMNILVACSSRNTCPQSSNHTAHTVDAPVFAGMFGMRPAPGHIATRSDQDAKAIVYPIAWQASDSVLTIYFVASGEGFAEAAASVHAIALARNPCDYISLQTPSGHDIDIQSICRHIRVDNNDAIATSISFRYNYDPNAGPQNLLFQLTLSVSQDLRTEPYIQIVLQERPVDNRSITAWQTSPGVPMLIPNSRGIQPNL